MKKQSGILAGVLLLSLLFTACGKPAQPPAETSAPSAADAAQATTPSPQDGEHKLFIGLSDNLQEVPYAGEETPEALIAVLAEETGWNLTLAKPVAEGPEENSLTVAFAADSAIYTAPPEEQKDAYHVYDAEDLIYSVLNSTAQTLLQNFQIASVYFTAPDGGNLDFENGGCSFYLTTVYPWDEAAVRQTNAPLPEDALGLVVVDPIGECCAGFENLNLLFMREDVHAGTGKVTVYDGHGEIFFQGDLTNADQVEFMEPEAEDLAFANWKSGSKARVWLGKTLQADEDYTVEIDAGAFVSGDIGSRAFDQGEWTFSCLDYGYGETNAPGNQDIKLGESVTQEIFLGESAERAVIWVDDADKATVSPSELTEDGTITFTPTATGDCEYEVRFYLKDGSVKAYGTTCHVVE